MNNAALVDDWVTRWHLTRDGEAIVTASSVLLPVRIDSLPAMLKVATVDEERRGAALLAWWDGQGAVRVLAREGDAVLMERAEGDASLAEMARGGRDDEASRVLCGVAARLHAPRASTPPAVAPLDYWFAGLWSAASSLEGIFARTAETARTLLGAPQDVVVLHGDLHHGNVLDGGTRGWLAIDPKGLVGERGFDFANIFCNPDADVATALGRLERQAAVVADAAALDRGRLLRWVFAYAGLSAAWSLEDGDDPGLALAVAAIVEGILEGRSG